MDSNSAIDFVVLRLDQSGTCYLIVSVRELIVQNSISVAGSVQCDYIDDMDSGILLERGDVLGFVNRDNLRVALAVLPEGASSSLRVYNFDLMRDGPEQTSVMQESTVPLVVVNDSIAQERFENNTQRVTPMIRVILSE